MIKSFALHNASKLYPNFDSWKPVVDTMNVQLSQHVGPSLGLGAPTVAYFSTSEFSEKFGNSQSGDVMVVHLVDDPDAPDALGYHDELKGTPFAKVFLKPTLDNGGTFCTGPNSVSVTLSHELIESVQDEYVQLWAMNYASGMLEAYEFCDAVEGDSYDVNGVAVSNFVLHRYFDSSAPAGSRLDYLGKLVTPFSLSPGGYKTILDGKTPNQVYGMAYPSWKKQAKAKNGRSAKRTKKWVITESDRPESTKPAV